MTPHLGEGALSRRAVLSPPSTVMVMVTARGNEEKRSGTDSAVHKADTTGAPGTGDASV